MLGVTSKCFNVNQKMVRLFLTFTLNEAFLSVGYLFIKAFFGRMIKKNKIQ